MSNYSNFNYPASGLNNVGEYQASGLPWVTSSQATTSPYQIGFPFVTNEITVTNSGSLPLRIGFTQNGVNGSNYFSVLAGQTVSFDVRVTYVYVRSDSSTANYSMFAGLTQIPAKSMPILTGSAVYDPNVTASIYGYASGLG